MIRGSHINAKYYRYFASICYYKDESLLLQVRVNLEQLRGGTKVAVMGNGLGNSAGET